MYSSNSNGVTNERMSKEPVAAIAKKILVRLKNDMDLRPDGFVEICAADFAITDHVLFACEMDKISHKEWIEGYPRSEIDGTQMSFTDVIKDSHTKVLVAITVAGLQKIKSF